LVGLYFVFDISMYRALTQGTFACHFGIYQVVIARICEESKVLPYAPKSSCAFMKIAVFRIILLNHGFLTWGL